MGDPVISATSCESFAGFFFVDFFHYFAPKNHLAFLDPVSSFCVAALWESVVNPK